MLLQTTHRKTQWLRNACQTQAWVFVRLLKCTGLSVFSIAGVLKGTELFLWMGFVKG